MLFRTGNRIISSFLLYSFFFFFFFSFYLFIFFFFFFLFFFLFFFCSFLLLFSSSFVLFFFFSFLFLFVSAESALYRSLVMKLAYVAQDRVDIAEAVKCLTRHRKEQRCGHMQEPKRLGRYLVKIRRCVLTYTRQTSDATLQVHVDSGWAGDLLGRKSTTGVIVRRGEHLFRHMSCLQTLVALSSGEAEYYALIRGACTSLGIQSQYQDWMIDVPILIYSDSLAARNVARR